MLPNSFIMKHHFEISYDIAESYENLNEIEKALFDRAKQTRAQAYAPYSNFLVGAAVLLDNGEIFSASNQENAAYPSSLCAERSAMYWIGANFPQQKIKKIFVIGGPRDDDESSQPIPPCGSCRQSLLEYETKQGEAIELYFSGLKGKIFKVNSIKDLLPFCFDSSFL